MNSLKMVASGSQTVGPYFRIGLEYLMGQETVDPSDPGAILLCGRVLDRDGASVPDAMLEFWGADGSGNYAGHIKNSADQPAGFHRVGTNADGGFSLTMIKPGPVEFGDGRMQAPHMLVLCFARGLLRSLITRVYFAQEPANDADPVLMEIPTERRHTLIAKLDEARPRVFQWDVVLQGTDETVFFAW